jgi:hypothetical protein
MPLVIVLAVPLCLGVMWFARWVGVPRPYDISVTIFVALVVIAFERQRRKP